MNTPQLIHEIDPLPRRFATQEPGVGGSIKVRPEDFIVDELPLYEPQGNGEHLYLCVQKTNVSHQELMSVLRRHFRVRDDQIGFAGMKDKAGVTRQMVSLHLLKDPESVQPAHNRITVAWAARHRNKLRLGHLAGNRFSIRIRNVDPLKAPLAMRTLKKLQSGGVPNYFGAQRFGYRHNNHLVGAALLRNDWQEVATLLLGTSGGKFPPYQRERRELFDQGKYAEAAELWTAADRSERIVASRLASGKRARQAVQGVGRTALAFWVSALQSAIFNRVLDERISEGTFTQLLEGDVAFKHATRGMFHITAAELDDGALIPRLESMEISPSGPLWGKGMMEAAGAVGAMERLAAEAAGITIDALMQSPACPEGARRPLRVQLKNAELDSGIDEHGQYIRVAFDLPRGSYATVALREIMKNPADADSQEPSEQSDAAAIEDS